MLRARHDVRVDEARERRKYTSRWTSFVADCSAAKPRTLFEEGNPNHRLRVEHNRETLLIHLSGETGDGWLVFAVDRATRRWAVGEARRQIDAAEHAFDALYGDT